MMHRSSKLLQWLVPIETFFSQRSSASIIVDSEQRLTTFHCLAMMDEHGRNEDLSGRFGAFLMSLYQPTAATLDLESTKGMTAMTSAIHDGNYQLLRFLLEAGASLDKGSPAVPEMIMMRVTSLLDMPKNGTTCAADLRWRRKVHHTTRKTARLIQVLLPYLHNMGDSNSLQEEAGRVLILQFVKRGENLKYILQLEIEPSELLSANTPQRSLLEIS